jgi:hypothetical protein
MSNANVPGPIYTAVDGWFSLSAHTFGSSVRRPLTTRKYKRMPSDEQAPTSTITASTASTPIPQSTPRTLWDMRQWGRSCRRDRQSHGSSLGMSSSRHSVFLVVSLRLPHPHPILNELGRHFIVTVGSLWLTPSGKCFYCQRNYTARCTSSILLGNPNYPGAQAQYLRVSFADACCYPLPAGMAPELGLLLCDILPTGYSAAYNARRLADEHRDVGVEGGAVVKGGVAVVIGCGPVSRLSSLP